MKYKNALTIGCIGDSITAGTGLAEPNENAFPAQLERILNDGTIVYNFGNGGKTMRNDLGVDSYVNSITYENLIQTASELDVVTIMLGTNDAYHAKGWTDHEKITFKKDCHSLFAKLSENNPSLQFILMNAPACFGEQACRYDMEPLRSLQEELVQELNDRGFKTRFFDMYSVTNGLGEHFPDGLHPNKTGHLKMAQALGSLILELKFDI